MTIELSKKELQYIALVLLNISGSSMNSEFERYRTDLPRKLVGALGYVSYDRYDKLKRDMGVSLEGESRLVFASGVDAYVAPYATLTIKENA